jgi:hypothetical protein
MSEWKRRQGSVKLLWANCELTAITAYDGDRFCSNTTQGGGGKWFPMFYSLSGLNASRFRIIQFWHLERHEAFLFLF